jgi:hypothetical protein
MSFYTTIYYLHIDEAMLASRTFFAALVALLVMVVYTNGTHSLTPNNDNIAVLSVSDAAHFTSLQVSSLACDGSDCGTDGYIPIHADNLRY